MASTSAGIEGSNEEKMKSIRDAFGDTVITIDQAALLLVKIGLSETKARAFLGNFQIKASMLIDFVCNQGGRIGRRASIPKEVDEEEELAKAALEPLHRIFNLCDADDSGDVAQEEITNMLKVYESVAPSWGLPQIAEDVEDLYALADTDGDQRLTWDEFFTHVLSMMRKAKRASVNTPKRKSVYEVEFSGILLSPRSREATAQLEQWSIDYWNLTHEEQMALPLQAIHAWDCDVDVKVSDAILQAFFSEVKKAYDDNPYHNFLHALATTHYVFKLMSSAGLTIKMSPALLFTLVVAAVCHDIGHRGYNNAFEIASQSELALRYSDKSPLEHHHTARAFEIALRSPGGKCNVFKSLDAATYAEVRRLMIQAILSTDMQLHKDHVEKLSSSPEQLQDPSFIVELFLHAADISNPLMPADVAARWGACIQAEWTLQVTAERELGLPVSVFMDVQDDPLKGARSALGFMDFVIYPMATPLFERCPKLVEPKKNLEENHRRQAKIVADLTA
jgi:hypothetical protein